MRVAGHSSEELQSLGADTSSIEFRRRSYTDLLRTVIEALAYHSKEQHRHRNLDQQRDSVKVFMAVFCSLSLTRKNECIGSLRFTEIF